MKPASQQWHQGEASPECRRVCGSEEKKPGKEKERFDLRRGDAIHSEYFEERGRSETEKIVLHLLASTRQKKEKGEENERAKQGRKA